jgi:hypothetical protein
MEGNIPTVMVRAPKKPRDDKGPGTYKETLTSFKIAICRETYPEDKITGRPGLHFGDTGGRVT